MKMILVPLLFGISVLAVAPPSSAQTPPARRPGLWEVRQGPAGMQGLPAVHICLSPAEAGGDFRPPRSDSAPGSKCNYQRLSSSSTEVRWRNVCTYQGETITMDGRAYDIKPEGFKQDIQMSGAMGNGTLHADARWVSADCSAAK